MGSQFVLGVDIGTGAIKAVLAENKDGKPLIRAAYKEPSMGVKKGVVMDLPDASSALARVLGDVRIHARSALKNVYVNVGTHQTRVQRSRGIVAVSRADSEIYEDDVDRVVKASQAVGVGPNRMLVHNVTREFIVDGVGDITDPLGLAGNRLEVHSLIVDAFAPHVKNVIRIVELIGGRIGGLVVNPIAGARSALSKIQKDLGVMCIDIGAGTTSVSIYEENKLLHIAILPVGTHHITNDIAVGLKIPVAVAEELKLIYGHARPSNIGTKELIDMKKLTPDGEGMISRRFVAEIIEARLAELFEFVNNELRQAGKTGGLPGGAIVVGGGARIPGITELARQELKTSTQLGASLPGEWAAEADASAPDYFSDPEFVTACGLVLWGAEKSGWKSEGGFAKFHPKNILRYFVP